MSFDTVIANYRASRKRLGCNCWLIAIFCFQLGCALIGVAEFAKQTNAGLFIVGLVYSVSGILIAGALLLAVFGPISFFWIGRKTDDAD